MYIRDGYRNRVPVTVQQKINTIISLHAARRISQFGTAERLMQNLATTNEKQRIKGLEEYDKAVPKYEEREAKG